MAELNFNALIPEGPRGFYQGFEQGQDQKIARETNQIKLEELKRDRDEMMQLRERLKSLGQDPDPSKFLDELARTGNPEHVKMAIEGKQKIKDLEAYAKLGVIESVTAAPAMPTGAPAAQTPVAPTNALAAGAAPAAPMNAMVPAPVTQTPTAPVNALAPQPGADQAARAQQRIDQLLMFARTNPRMAPQAMTEAKILQDQLELFSRRAPATPAFVQEYEYAKNQGYKGSLFDFKRELASAGRAPAQPAQPSAPVAVLDPATGKQIYVSREEALRNRMSPPAATESLTPKEIQKREAAYPQATSSVKGFESKSDLFIKDLKALRDDKGLDQITGSIYGRTPSVSREGSRAQALYNKIFAKGGFQALQDMRDASKTGGALGNVSNQEGERLERSVVGGLDRTQNVDDVKKGINDLIEQIEGSKVRMREAYDMTYDYKRAKPAAAGGAWKDL